MVTIAGVVVIVWGYGIARHKPMMLYTPPAWTRYVTAVLMLPVFPLFLAAYFPGRIKAALQHPMLLSVMLWALAHLIGSGMLANVVLFGGFLAWAVVDRISFRCVRSGRTPRRHLQGRTTALPSWRVWCSILSSNTGCTPGGSESSRCRSSMFRRVTSSSATDMRE